MRYRHSGSLGDIIYALAAVKDMVERSGERARFLLATDRPAQHAPGFRHPSGNVLLSRPFAESLLPLLRRQPYVESADLYAGEPVEVDLDDFRKLPHLERHSIGRWYSLCHHCTPKLWQPWLTAAPVETFRGYVVVSRTSRYRNPCLDYGAALRGVPVVFLGLPEEYEAIRRELPEAVLHTAADLHQAAGILRTCRAFVGNASAMFALAEGLKIPRVLEVYPAVPNTTVSGPGPAYECLRQDLFAAAVSEVAGL